MGDEKRDEVEEKVEEIHNFDVSVIARTKELGSALGFTESAKEAEIVISIFKLLDHSQLSKLPPKYRKIIVQQADAFMKNVQKFSEYDPNTTDTNARQNIIDQFTQYRKSVHDQLAGPIVYQRALNFNSDEQLDLERERIKGKERELNEALENLKKIEKEFAGVSEKMRTQAAESGVTQEAVHFSDEADRHEEGAVNWRRAIIAISLVIVAYAVASIFFIDPPEKVAEVINFVANKLMIFGVLVYLLSVATKNYMSNMHNRTVNRHRKNALLTYNTLAAGALGDEVKDKILESASACIYSHQDTGYIKQNSPSSINSVIEMMPKTVLDGKITDG